MRLPDVRKALIQLALQPRQWAKSLSQWVPGPSSSLVTVMTVDGQWLKWVEVTSGRVTRCLVFPVERASTEEIVKTFHEAITAASIVARDVLVATPSHLSTLRLFSLPSTDPKEIRDIIDLQAEKHTPYAKEEVLTDFSVIDRSRSGYSRVLLVIAHQDVVQRAVRLAEALGCSLDRVGSEFEGLVNWFNLLKKRAGKAPQGASLVIDVDGGTTTLLVMERGQPQLHRSLATGMTHLQEEPVRAGERLVSDIQRSLEAIDAEGGIGKIQDVVVTGRVGRLGELKLLIEKTLGTPVTLVSPLEGAAVSESLQSDEAQLPDVSCASLVGLALAPSAIDLTPQATKLHQAFEARAKALVLLGCQGVAALILASLLVIVRAQKEQRYLAALRRTYQQSAKEALYVEEGLRELEFVRAHLHQQGLVLEGTARMAAACPSTVHWESLTFTQGEGFALKGIAEASTTVYEFVAALDRLPIFGQVEARRVAKRKSAEGDMTEYEIICPLASAAKPAPGPAKPVAR